MLFNSLEFAVFLPIVFLLYWFIVNKSIKVQNVLLVVASYIFYGWWDWRFLSLIAFSSLVDYFVSLQLAGTEKPRDRKMLLFISVGVNIGLLGMFKYFNFFMDNLVGAFSLFGYDIAPTSLSIVLPVGISFYTFQTLSYTIDVYRKKLEPTRDLVAFLAFVSFFPQLVAGPIERASHLLPQFYKKREFNYALAVDGLRQMLWGLFKKIVIADNCARYANEIFNHYTDHTGSTLVLGAVFFAFQIYGDFSGYSDIAIGTARLFGFDLMRNFAYPYFSRNIAEFWRRWHISLSTWFRDYIYIPLGGSRGGKLMQLRNTMIIFLVSGFWHGANWTFIMWGFIHAMLFLPLLLMNVNRNYLDNVAEGRLLPNVKEFFEMGITFALACLAWIFFRAPNIHVAFDYIARIFNATLFTKPAVRPIVFIVLVLLFVGVEWLQRDKQHALQFDQLTVSRTFRWSCYYLLIFSIWFFKGEPQQFIYFQF